MNTQATGEIRPETTRPNFKHRIDGNLTDALDLADIISMMTFRAKGILNLASVNIDSDNQAGDDILKGALCAAIAEIEDIEVTIQAFHQAMLAGGAQ